MPNKITNIPVTTTTLLHYLDWNKEVLALLARYFDEPNPYALRQMRDLVAVAEDQARIMKEIFDQCILISLTEFVQMEKERN